MIHFPSSRIGIARVTEAGQTCRYQREILSSDVELNSGEVDPEEAAVLIDPDLAFEHSPVQLG